MLAEEPAEKKAKVPAKEWFDTSEAHANEQEIMFFSLLLISHANTVKELDEWAQKVRLETGEAERLREACMAACD